MPVPNKLPNYLFVSECDGHLYDTRKQGWHKLPPVRHTYCRTKREIKTTVDMKATLRAGDYAWPGGYPMFLFTQDGAALCFDCARKEFRQIVWDIMNKCSTGWRVIGTEINYEDEDLVCAHCSKPIESAYGEKEPVDSKQEA